MRASQSGDGPPNGGAFIGRCAELARIESAVASVASGAPGILLFTGLEGIGTTRLAYEALDSAAAAGFATFRGRATELDRDLAYGPFVGAFSGYLGRLERDERDSLLLDLSQLGLLFAGLGLSAVRPVGDPEVERVRLLSAMACLIERLASLRPMALLVDDAHFMDASSASLLRHLTDSLTGAPVLVVLTAQPDRAAAKPMRVLLHHLSTSPWWLDRVQVDPLSDSESADLFARALSRPAGVHLLDEVIARCAGRPLFLESLAHTLNDAERLAERPTNFVLNSSRITLPRDIQDELGSRLATLDDDERAITRILATAVDACNLRLLRAACDLADPALTAAIDRLERRHLIVSSDRGYVLAHRMLIDTVMARLTQIQRQLLHARLARTIADVEPNNPACAEHVILAGDVIPDDEALPLLLVGAHHARSVGAVDDAVRYLEIALTAATTDPIDLQAQILGELGDLSRTAGRLDVARGYWTDALTIYVANADPLGTSRAHRELGMLTWSAGDLTGARQHLDEAGQSLAQSQPSAEHAELMHARTMMATRLGDAEEVTATAAELRRLADELGAPEFSARAYLAEAFNAFAVTDFERADASNELALTAARAAGQPMLEARAYDQFSIVAASAADIERLRRFSAASLKIATQLGAPMMEAWPRSRLMMADFLAGDWNSALATAGEVIELGHQYGDHRGRVSSHAMYAWLLAHRGRLTEARQYLDRATEIARGGRGPSSTNMNVVVASTTLALAEGHLSLAAELGAPLANLAIAWYPIVALEPLAVALATSGQAAEATELTGRLRSLKSCGTEFPAAIADWVDGLALPEHSEALLARAADAFDRVGTPYYAARARLSRATALRRTDTTSAVRDGTAALVVFDRLGAARHSKLARELLRDLGTTPSRGRSHHATGSPLSTRELEVARLVASGRSNADVATELFISPRTVTTHLDRIYARLGLNSRVALTRYLADSGLLDESRPGT
ncbi:putative ATPase [Antricoccus suffuscus]|uniref:Putative ATPase n=1 Tax=Antricoccus suffuscus TaxID=1629062 RepID=A0A2T1A301_9ACTN|nr:AAA family ATPase [Antricoccus suffuscus]PRZ42989.1 putative ATPase [Antricoccus suffuscus]